MTQQLSRALRVNRRCNRGTVSVGEAGGQALAAKCWGRLEAILKPAARVRVLGVVLVPSRCWRRCAVPLAGCGAGKEKPGAKAGLGGGGVVVI